MMLQEKRKKYRKQSIVLIHWNEPALFGTAKTQWSYIAYVGGREVARMAQYESAETAETAARVVIDAELSRKF